MQCPYFKSGIQCTGKLIRLHIFHTDLGTINGLDNNHHQEGYKCDKCDKKILRGFKWAEYKTRGEE